MTNAAIPATTADSYANADLANLFRQYHGEMVRLALLMVRDRPTAEDVVQDVFARLHARPGSRPRPGRELAYLRASVLNGCRSVYRRRAVAERLGLASTIDSSGWPPSSAPTVIETSFHESAESEAIRADDCRRLLVALNGLSVRRREVLVLRYYLGLSEAEIAATLGISPGGVKSTASRGLAALARSLGEES